MPRNVLLPVIMLFCVVHVDDQGGGHLLAFFDRPVAATLGVLALAVWFPPLLMRRLRRLAGA